MNSTTQTPAMLGASNPFVRGYDNLSIERLLLITYANDCPPCFRSVHDSQAYLPDDALELFPCLFCDDFAIISEDQLIPDELDERCQFTGLVRQVIYAVNGEMLSELHHVGDLYSLEEAQAMVHRLNFETGHYSRAWEISTAHLTEDALRYLEHRAGSFNTGPTGLLFEPFALRDCNGFGCKLIGTPWTDDNRGQSLLGVEARTARRRYAGGFGQRTVSGGIGGCEVVDFRPRRCRLGWARHL